MQTFLEEIFRPFHRPEQRRWAQVYLRGLIHVSGRKTPRSMARSEQLPPKAAQGLHQFISASPWDWEAVRRRLALRAAASAAPYAWTVTELLIPKRGEHSVGVHPCLDTATGRTVNCQRAVGLFLVTDAQCFPVDWSLVLDGSWGWDPERRLRARIPDEETARPAGACVLDYVTRVAAQPGLPRVPWVLDLTRSEDASGILVGLARHRVDIVCEVDPGQIVLAGHRAPTVTTIGKLMEEHNTRQPYAMVRQTTDGRSRTVPLYTYAGTARLPRRSTGGDGGGRGYRLLELLDPDGRQPARYWITTLADRCAERILTLMRSRTAVRATLTALQKRYGVLDFEGRSFPGWHRHMTMTAAAYVYQHLHGHVTPAQATAPATAPALAGAVG
ncbi:transcriptional regulator [Streptomyces sp. GC420]|nr:transcriptional regulator [Streptomyces sp. GC420]